MLAALRRARGWACLAGMALLAPRLVAQGTVSAGETTRPARAASETAPGMPAVSVPSSSSTGRTAAGGSAAEPAGKPVAEARATAEKQRAPVAAPIISKDMLDAAPRGNRLILEEIARAEQGGGYSTARGASQRLSAAFATTAGVPFQPSYSKPSFCSSATYVVFVRALGRLAGGSEPERRRLAGALAANGQVDGVGVWGRWNANGPGTAALFHESRIGRNFTDWNDARPGDFAKLFWNDQIGVKERGHSVIFLGLTPSGDGVRFWSSNQPGGYGEKTVPMSAVKRVIFSRLDPGARFGRLAELPETDQYLASLNRVATTPAEVFDRIGYPAR